MILEDLHWADTSSLRLLSYAAESLNAPVLIIITRRTADVRVSDALTSTLASLARNGAERIRLDGLGPAEVSELLSREIDDPAPALAGVVTARTEGNPFFVLELGRLLRARGVSDAAEAAQIAVPEGIADVLRLRLGRLEPRARARHILAIAAVAGRAVDPRLIMTVSRHLDGRGCWTSWTPPRPPACCPRSVQGYQFSHALVRETIYADCPAGRRTQLHAEVADALQSRLIADPELRTEVAHHFWLAAPLDPAYATKAVEHLRAAARTADARNAFDESTALWAQALAAVGDDRPGRSTGALWPAGRAVDRRAPGERDGRSP